MTLKKTTARLLCALIALSLALSLALPVFASYPKHENYVADSASVLAENTVRTLRTANKTLKEDYGVVVAICTVKTTGELTPKEYAHAIFSEWKLGECVILLIASDDQEYYIVQSKGLDDIITNEQLRLVRDDYLEPDFSTGNIDRAVQKSATKLTSIIERGLDKKTSENEGESGEGEGTTAGDVIITILKIFLIVSLSVIGIFGILFVVALFNDPVADFMSKYIFNRKKNKGYRIPDYYDERLYGRGQNGSARRVAPARDRQMSANGARNQYPAEYRNRQRQNPGQAPVRRPRPNPENRVRDEYNNQRQNHADVYYNSDGTVRRTPGAQNPQRQRPLDDDATRTFTIPEQYNRRR